MDISSLSAYPSLSAYSPSIAKITDSLDAQAAAMQQSIDGLHRVSASYEVKISEYGQIQSDLASLLSAAQGLSGPDAFSRFHAKSTDPAVLTAYAQGSALPGIYNVEVNQLAQGETLVSAAQPDPAAAIGSGAATITFQFRNGASHNIAINQANNTLSGIAASINRADIGISALVASDGPASRLVLNGPSGASNAFNIAVSGDDAIRHLLSYTDGAIDNAMSQTVAAQNSQGSVGGAPFSGHSNVLVNAARGLTLNLSGIGHAAVTISTDLSQISDAVKSFIDAYNLAQSDIATYLTNGLSGDRTLSALSNQLATELEAKQSGADASPPGSLAQIGIARNQDGTLSFNSTTFQEAYSRNPAGVAHLFTDDGKGLADQIANQIRDVIQPGGNISSTINQLLAQIRGNQQTESRIQDTAMRDMQYSAHQYAQQLAMMIVMQIMEQFMQTLPPQPDQRPEETLGVSLPAALSHAAALRKKPASEQISG